MAVAFLPCCGSFYEFLRSLPTHSSASEDVRHRLFKSAQCLAKSVTAQLVRSPTLSEYVHAQIKRSFRCTHFGHQNVNCAEEGSALSGDRVFCTRHFDPCDPCLWAAPFRAFQCLLPVWFKTCLKCLSDIWRIVFCIDVQVRTQRPTPPGCVHLLRSQT